MVTLPEQLVVLGAGVDGQAAAGWALRRGTRPLVVDDHKVGLQVHGITVRAPADVTPTSDMWVVRSASVPLDHPLLVRTRAAGVRVVGSLDLWLEHHRTPLVLAVTGTKGKSTTVKLAGALLEESGVPHVLVGNGQTPMLSSAATDARDPQVQVAVVEVSSYMAADMQHSVDVAAVCSLYADHVDWHGNVEAYHAAKLRLVSPNHAVVAVLPASDVALRQKVQQPPPQVSSVCWVDCVDGRVRVGGRWVTSDLSHVAVREGLLGNHNLENLAVACGLLHTAGFALPDVASALQQFTPAPHRLQPVAATDKVVFVNDSVATVVQAAAAAVAAVDTPVALIAGGLDRQQDWCELADIISQRGVLAVAAVGQTRNAIQVACEKAGVPCASFGSLRLATRWAANQLPGSGGTVLLSPAAASYDQHTDFAERGDVFTEAARHWVAQSSSNSTAHPDRCSTVEGEPNTEV